MKFIRGCLMAIGALTIGIVVLGFVGALMSGRPISTVGSKSTPAAEQPTLAATSPQVAAPTNADITPAVNASAPTQQPNSALQPTSTSEKPAAAQKPQNPPATQVPPRAATSTPVPKPAQVHAVGEVIP